MGTSLPSPRVILVGIGTTVLVAVIGASAWFHRNVPPDCEASDTIERVREQLHDRYGLAEPIALTSVQTVAGGILAVRFACKAELPQPSPIGSEPIHVSYESRKIGRQHQVTVSLEPTMRWHKVQ